MAILCPRLLYAALILCQGTAEQAGWNQISLWLDTLLPHFPKKWNKCKFFSTKVSSQKKYFGNRWECFEQSVYLIFWTKYPCFDWFFKLNYPVQLTVLSVLLPRWDDFLLSRFPLLNAGVSQANMGTKAEYPAIIDPKIDPLCSVPCILCYVSCILCYVSCILCFVLCTLCYVTVDNVTVHHCVHCSTAV